MSIHERSNALPTSALSRRRLLACGITIAATTHIAGQAAIADEQAESAEAGTDRLVIDAHSHVWTSDVARYPLAAGFTQREMQPPSFTPAELLAQAQPCGVNRVVLIQMSYYRFDNRYLLDAIREHPGTFSGVAVIDAHAHRLRDTIRDLKAQGIRGFRIHPGGEKPAAWLASESMISLWKLGASEQMAMCALINPDALMPLDTMCEKFPETTLVIDHFARIGIDGTVRQSQIDQLCKLARHPRTFVKVSAFYALGKKQSPYTDLGPMIRQLLAAFGPQRLMWATDCPYQVEQGHTYRDSVELVRSRLDFLSKQDKHWLLGGTAERLFFT